MKRHMTLLSAMLAGAAFAQTAATSTTTIGEVTLTRPVAAPTQTEVEADTAAATQTPAQAASAAAVATASAASTAPVKTAPVSTSAASTAEPAQVEATQTEVTQTTAEPVSEQPAQTQPQVVDGVEVVQAQPLQPVAAPKPINPPAAPAAATPAKPAKPAQAQSTQTAKPAQATPKTATSTPAVAASSVAMPTATTAKATPIAAPSDLPSGWRHLSGDIFGSKAVSLPAGSTIQVAVEAVNKTTGLHTPHLLVHFGADSLPANYYLNYNPGRMNTAKYNYVVQAKVFDAHGDMLYMSDSRQPLPTDIAAKLKIDMRF